jgi:hypothetical protein
MCIPGMFATLQVIGRILLVISLDSSTSRRFVTLGIFWENRIQRTSTRPRRPSADRQPFHPAVGFGGRYGGRPFRPLIVHSDRRLGCGRPFRPAFGVAVGQQADGRADGLAGLPSHLPATPTAKRSGHPYPNHRSKWATNGRNGRPPCRLPKLTTGWSAGCLWGASDVRRIHIRVHRMSGRWTTLTSQPSTNVFAFG